MLRTIYPEVCRTERLINEPAEMAARWLGAGFGNKVATGYTKTLRCDPSRLLQPCDGTKDDRVKLLCIGVGQHVDNRQEAFRYMPKHLHSARRQADANGSGIFRIRCSCHQTLGYEG